LCRPSLIGCILAAASQEKIACLAENYVSSVFKRRLATPQSIFFVSVHFYLLFIWAVDWEMD